MQALYTIVSVFLVNYDNEQVNDTLTLLLFSLLENHCHHVYAWMHIR